LRSIIESRRLTAYAVATASGLAPSVVSRFLTGERTLSGDRLDAVCSALGLELCETRRRRFAGAKAEGWDPRKE
jgi:transcriptional regulator with XRE-family HTH domain